MNCAAWSAIVSFFMSRSITRLLCPVTSQKGSFAPTGPGTVPVETVKVIRPNHVSGLSRINVSQCRKRCTGRQKGSPFSPFRTIRKSASFSLCRGGRDVRHHHHQKQKQ